VVRVEADHSRARRTAAAGVALAAAGTLSTVVLAVVVGPLFLIAAPIELAVGIGVGGGARSRANALAREVDRVLDAVDDNIAPTRLRADVARRLVGRLHRSVV
jgi:hypothetical protein